MLLTKRILHFWTHNTKFYFLVKSCWIYIENKNIIKLKDKTKVEYDLEKISKEQSLKGIFVKELLEQINEENREQILESIYIGLNLM